jgi:hypothetical protein
MVSSPIHNCAAQRIAVSTKTILGKVLIVADGCIVPRPDTEDEDTEQKIINEGTSSTTYCLYTQLTEHYRVQDVEEK